MQFTCKIVGSDKNGAVKLEQELPPADGSIIKLRPGFGIKHYFLQVEFPDSYIPERVNILLNGFEWIGLEAAGESAIFRSQNLNQSRGKGVETQHLRFFEGNLGIYEFRLFVDEQEFELTSVDAEYDSDPMIRAAIRKMYLIVDDSNDYPLELAHYNRAIKQQVNVGSEQDEKSFYPTLLAALELAKQCELALAATYTLATRVTTTDRLAAYSRAAPVSPKGLDWLANNPQELTEDYSGALSVGGRRFSVGRVPQLHASNNLDNEVNRVVATSIWTAIGVLSGFREIMRRHPFMVLSSLNRVIERLKKVMARFVDVSGVGRPFNSFPSPSTHRAVPASSRRLWSAICEWYEITGSFRSGSHVSRICTPNITRVYERLCLVQFHNIFECLGFRRLNSEASGYVGFYRGQEEVKLFYEPRVANTGIPVVQSLSSGFLTPDYVIHYSDGRSSTVGVLDAKFTRIWNSSMDHVVEFNYKYGLCIHKPDGRPLDYVIAILPDFSGGKFRFDSTRQGAFKEDIAPLLGKLKVPINKLVDENYAKSFYAQITTAPRGINNFNLAV